MNKITQYLIFIFLIAIISCSSKSNDVEYLFKDMIENPILEDGLNLSILYPDVVKGVTNNNYQDKIYKLGKSANTFLLEKAKSLRETKYVIPNIIGPMKKSDVAICLLLDINLISDSEFINQLIVNEIKEDYKLNGDWVWWDWMNKNMDNRLYIINQLKKIIDVQSIEENIKK